MRWKMRCAYRHSARREEVCIEEAGSDFMFATAAQPGIRASSMTPGHELDGGTIFKSCSTSAEEPAPGARRPHQR